MTEYKFYLIELTTTETVTEIEEPQGWSEVVLRAIRRDEWHGVFFEATVSTMGFYGVAAEILRYQKETYGLRANVVFRAVEICETDPEKDVIRGRVNFGKYRRTCGVECIVNVPIENETCVMTLNNRIDQKVDMAASQAFDRLTVLPDYAGLNFEMSLPPKELFVGVVGSVDPSGSVFDVVDVPGAGQGVLVRPVFSQKQNESINASQLEPINEYGTYGTFPMAVSPVLLLDDNPRCFDGTYNVYVRLKGTYSITLNTDSGSIVGGTVGLTETDDITTDSDNEIILAQDALPSGGSSKSGSFDFEYSNPNQVLRQGFGLYPVIGWSYVKVGGRVDVVVNWAPETRVSITTSKLCPPTPAKVSLINESLARAVEAITNRCLTVKSDYYGRVDSQPYASPTDGCGSLRVLTSGLHIRIAENAAWFTSVDGLIKGLRAIDNVGMGMEPNPNLPGFDWLRIEPVDYFYADFEILQFPYIPRAVTEVDESKHYSVIKVGYTRWETGGINGLQEFNSNREYRTSLDTVKNTLDIQSDLVAGAYPLEITRQQSFAEAGGADTSYDNETFIICVERDAYGYKPEQGNITAPENIFGPSTVYNWRISPLRNLMRWFKSIASGYTNLADSASKLFFNSGTGNFIAAGQLVDDCALENGPNAENKDLSIQDFKNQQDYLPLIRPETVTFDYPFTRAEYQKLRDNPRGYCSYQCGNGEWLKGYIMDLQWTPAKGTAEIKLRLKW